MTEMITRVRDAMLTDQMRRILEAGGLELREGQDELMAGAARRAIDALRKPTEAMDNAFHSAIDRWMKMECEFEDVLGAVLDAALSEPDEAATREMHAKAQAILRDRPKRILSEPEGEQQ
jgi:hypothetical protein